MHNLTMRTNLLIRGNIADTSRDLKTILEMQKAAAGIKEKAEKFKDQKFDNCDQPAGEGEITIITTYNSEEAVCHAEKLVSLMEEVKKEAEEFYKCVGIKVVGPAGEATGRVL